MSTALVTDATLVDATGSIFVERDGQRIALNEGDGIYESDIIITGPDTTAEILFRDGTKSRLSPDTELTLVDFDFGAGEEPSFIMDLAQGAMRTVSGEVVKLNPEAFELITPRATVGIRGTEFFNSVDGANEIHAVLFIADGHIMMVTGQDGKSINMSAPLQMITMQAGDEGPLTIRKFSMAEMEQMITVLAPTLGENLPQNEADQGDWENLDLVVNQAAEKEQAEEQAAEEQAAEEQAAEEQAAEEQAAEEQAAEEQAAEPSAGEEQTSEAVAAESVAEAAKAANVTTVAVIVVDAKDSNNDALLDALEEAGISTDIIDGGLVDESDSDELLVADADLDLDLDLDTDTDADTDPVIPPSTGSGGAELSPEPELPEPEPELPTPPTPSDPEVTSYKGTLFAEGGLGSVPVTGDGVEYEKNKDIEGEHHFGADRITIGAMDGSSGIVSGDLGAVINPAAGKFVFGDDSIEIGTMSGGTIYGDLESIESSTASTDIEFGDDNITVTNMSGGAIYGDSGDVNSEAGGKDLITIGILNDEGKLTGGEMTGGTINGGAGNDKITVLGDMDGGTINGGAGIDEITVTSMRSGTINGEAGADEIIITTVDMADGNEITINGGAGDDKITLGAKNPTDDTGTIETGDDRYITIDGGAGDDTITINLDGSSGEIRFENFGEDADGVNGRDVLALWGLDDDFKLEDVEGDDVKAIDGNMHVTIDDVTFVFKGLEGIDSDSDALTAYNTLVESNQITIAG